MMTDKEKRLIELVTHCWIHSGEEMCGYSKMTNAQKELFDSITNPLPVRTQGISAMERNPCPNL